MPLRHTDCSGEADRGSHLDELAPGMQQNGVGVQLGPQLAVAVVEVVGERLWQLVGAAAVIDVVALHSCRMDRNVVTLGWGVAPSAVAQVCQSGSNAVLWLDLQGNQGWRNTWVLADSDECVYDFPDLCSVSVECGCWTRTFLHLLFWTGATREDDLQSQMPPTIIWKVRLEMKISCKYILQNYYYLIKD